MAPAAVAAALAAAPLPWADPEEWDNIAGKLDGHMLEIQNGPDAGGFFSLCNMNNSTSAVQLGLHSTECISGQVPEQVQ